MPDRKVDFVIGGVQKGGTTALFEYIRRFTDAVTPDHGLVRQYDDGLARNDKELHFFDCETPIDWANAPYGEYESNFPDRAGARGEATPIYIYWPNCLERMFAYNRNMRLVFIFRHPVDRALSHWKMERDRSWETLSFSAAIREGRTRVDDPAARGHHRCFSYVERGMYAAQLRRAYTIFPRDQILNLSSTDLATDPGGTLQRVARHIGVAVEAQDIGELRMNVAKSTSALSDEDRDYLLGEYRADLAAFQDMTGLMLQPEF